MPRHRTPRSRLGLWVRRAAFSVAVLAGSTVVGMLAAGAMWLAVQLPGPRSPDRVIRIPEPVLFSRPPPSIPNGR